MASCFETHLDNPRHPFPSLPSSLSFLVLPTTPYDTTFIDTIVADCPAEEMCIMWCGPGPACLHVTSLLAMFALFCVPAQTRAITSTSMTDDTTYGGRKQGVSSEFADHTRQLILENWRPAAAPSCCRQQCVQSVWFVSVGSNLFHFIPHRDEICAGTQRAINRTATINIVRININSGINSKYTRQKSCPRTGTKNVCSIYSHQDLAQESRTNYLA